LPFEAYEEQKFDDIGQKREGQRGCVGERSGQGRAPLGAM